MNFFSRWFLCQESFVATTRVYTFKVYRVDKRALGVAVSRLSYKAKQSASLFVLS